MRETPAEREAYLFSGASWCISSGFTVARGNICDAQPGETEQLAVSLKMTIIKVTMKMDLVILPF